MMNAIALPVRSALAGQRMMRCRLKVTMTSISAQVRSEAAIWGNESAKWNCVMPSA